MVSLKGRLEQLEKAQGGNGPLLVFVDDDVTTAQVRCMAEAQARGRVVIPVNSLDARI